MSTTPTAEERARLRALCEAALACASSWEPNVRLLGNVTARDLAALASEVPALLDALDTAEAELHKWRTARTHGGCEEERLAEVARRVEAEARADGLQDDLDALHEQIAESLPHYAEDADGKDEANAIDTVEMAGSELRRAVARLEAVERERDEAVAALDAAERERDARLIALRQSARPAHVRMRQDAGRAHGRRLRQDRVQLRSGDVERRRQSVTGTECARCGRNHPGVVCPLEPNYPTRAEHSGPTERMLNHGRLRALEQERDALHSRLDAEERAHHATLAERDRHEEQCAEMASQAGCEREWSNAHDHRSCVAEAFAVLQSKCNTAERDRNEARDLLAEQVEIVERLHDERLRLRARLDAAVGAHDSLLSDIRNTIEMAVAFGCVMSSPTCGPLSRLLGLRDRLPAALAKSPEGSAAPSGGPCECGHSEGSHDPRDGECLAGSPWACRCRSYRPRAKTPPVAEDAGRVALTRAMTKIATGIRAELDRGYVLTEEPGAGPAWRRRWNALLAEAESALSAPPPQAATVGPALSEPGACPSCNHIHMRRDLSGPAGPCLAPGCACANTDHPAIIYRGTAPTPYEAEGRCWRCGGPDERDTLNVGSKRPRRPVCCSCAVALLKNALKDDPAPTRGREE